MGVSFIVFYVAITNQRIIFVFVAKLFFKSPWSQLDMRGKVEGSEVTNRSNKSICRVYAESNRRKKFSAK